MFGSNFTLPAWMGNSPADVIWRRRSLRLLHYRPATAAKASYARPLLIVPSMINRHYVVDLMPGRSLVGHLVEAGIDCYLVDWGKASAEDRLLDFDACIEDRALALEANACWHGRA